MYPWLTFAFLAIVGSVLIPLGLFCCWWCICKKPSKERDVEREDHDDLEEQKPSQVQKKNPNEKLDTKQKRLQKELKKQTPQVSVEKERQPKPKQVRPKAKQPLKGQLEEKQADKADRKLRPAEQVPRKQQQPQQEIPEQHLQKSQKVRPKKQKQQPDNIDLKQRKQQQLQAVLPKQPQHEGLKQTQQQQPQYVLPNQQQPHQVQSQMQLQQPQNMLHMLQQQPHQVQSQMQLQQPQNMFHMLQQQPQDVLLELLQQQQPQQVQFLKQLQQPQNVFHKLQQQQVQPSQHQIQQPQLHRPWQQQQQPQQLCPTKQLPLDRELNRLCKFGSAQNEDVCFYGERDGEDSEYDVSSDGNQEIFPSPLEQKANLVLQAMMSSKNFGKKFTLFDHGKSGMLNYRLPNNAMANHFTKVAFNKKSAVEVSDQREDHIFTNTVFERPFRFDLIYIEGRGHRLVSDRRLRTIECRWSEEDEEWYAEDKGRCFAIFSFINRDKVHLLAKASLYTSIY